MAICPVCGFSLSSTICTNCTFDTSTDVETYGSLAKLESSYKSISERKRELSLYLSCPKCKCMNLAFSEQDLSFRCRNCDEHIISEGIARLLSRLDGQAPRQNLDNANEAVTFRRAQNAVLSDKSISPRIEPTSKRASELRSALDFGHEHTVVLNDDGTVFASGNNSDGRCDVSTWRDIVSIAAGASHTIGLQANGKVTAVGSDTFGQCSDALHWSNIVEIDAGDDHTVAINRDGSLFACGNNHYSQCNVSSWKNIRSVVAGKNHTVGLRSDGQVIAAGDNSHGQCDVLSWKRIKAVAAGSNHTLGLTEDGKVVSTGDNKFNQCNTETWENIVSVSAGKYHSVGLCSDGKVMTSGGNHQMQCNTQRWKDIIFVKAAQLGTLGIKKDGSIVETGSIPSLYIIKRCLKQRKFK